METVLLGDWYRSQLSLEDCTSGTTFRYLKDFTLIICAFYNMEHKCWLYKLWVCQQLNICAFSSSLSTPTAVMLIWVSSVGCMVMILRCLSAYRLRNKSGKRLNDFDKGFKKEGVLQRKLQSGHGCEPNTFLLPILPCWVLETRHVGYLGNR